MASHNWSKNNKRLFFGVTKILYCMMARHSDSFQETAILSPLTKMQKRNRIFKEAKKSHLCSQ